MAIDEVRALKLLDGNKELLGELAALFAEDSVQLMNDFDRAVTARDHQRVALAVHSLKGITATFFADAELELLTRVEGSAFHSDWDQLEMSRNQIRKALASIVKEMDESNWRIMRNRTV